jgi:hypothetical protein
VRESAPWWALLGRLLPREVRERVYEPACYERLRDALQHRSQLHAGVGLYAINVFLGTAGRNLPRIWFDGDCLSGMGRLAVGIGLTAIGAWLILIVRYAYAY